MATLSKHVYGNAKNRPKCGFFRKPYCRSEEISELLEKCRLQMLSLFAKKMIYAFQIDIVASLLLLLFSHAINGESRKRFHIIFLLTCTVRCFKTFSKLVKFGYELLFSIFSESKGCEKKRESIFLRIECERLRN